MTCVVTESCIKCKHMDCVEVCPVDCLYEGENMLVIHPEQCTDCGVEAAVVGKQDDDELVKPKAFVVLRAGAVACEALAEALKAHVKAAIAPYQYPRWVEFCDSLPKTATGKIQRYKLRGEIGEYSRIE